ncbi:MAG TPA: transcription elongation factor GreA [Dehalococcoidia bacterium]|nr:transcription elongation factor GreA [Dehalococcoidia bacterium]
MAQESLTLAQLTARFLGSLPAEARQDSQADAYHFVRWCGADRPAAALTPYDIELYLESLGSGTADLERRLDAVRDFLAFAKKSGFVPKNLAPLVRRRRPASAKPSRLGALEAAPMTAEGYEALKRDLETLKARRPQMAAELQRARADKDFRENAPLDAAREEQARLEGRIRYVESLLGRAVTVDHRGEEAHVRLGSTIVLRNLTSGQALRYTLASPSEVNTAQGCISIASPVGKALLERRVGEEVEVIAPAGALRFRIEEIEL